MSNCSHGNLDLLCNVPADTKLKVPSVPHPTVEKRHADEAVKLFGDSVRAPPGKPFLGQELRIAEKPS